MQPPIKRPDTEDLLRAADAFAVGRAETERTTRIWLWWRDNDAYRDPQTPWVPLPQRHARQVASTERLKELLTVKHGEQRLMLAELERESENFGACISVLAARFRTRAPRGAVPKLRKLAAEHVSRVTSISSPQP